MLCVAAVLAAALAVLAWQAAQPASAAVASDAKAAARVATAQGYRTGVAVLDTRRRANRDPQH
jgi:hypothetical protein